MDIDMGVVCGKVSGNMVAAEFTGLGAYRHWQQDFPEVAKKLPTVLDGNTYTVLFRTTEALDSGLFAVMGFEGYAGIIHGEGTKSLASPQARPSTQPPDSCPQNSSSSYKPPHL